MAINNRLNIRALGRGFGSSDKTKPILIESCAPVVPGIEVHGNPAEKLDGRRRAKLGEARRFYGSRAHFKNSATHDLFFAVSGRAHGT
jgi:hypothetical protein